MADKKITKKERFAQLYEIVENSTCSDKTDLLGFIDHQVELLEKKASSKGMTKTQKENETLKELIVETMANIGKPVTVSELMKTDELGEYTNQKLSALLRLLIADGKVVKTNDKKTSLFSLAE